MKNKFIIISFVAFLILVFVLLNYIWPFFHRSRDRQIYNSNYTAQEISFWEEKIYPKAQTPENMIEIYANALKTKDKLTVKLLSTPMFLTISPEMWNQQFETFWEKYQDQEMSYSNLKYNKTSCEKSFEITRESQTQSVCADKQYYGSENRIQISNPSKVYYVLEIWK